jgi:polysaccharide biosynthesis/export protein
MRRGRASASTTLLALIVLSVCPAAAPAAQDAPALPIFDYRIGPKDLLEITVFELKDLNQTVRVAEDGSVTLTMLGRVEVAGLTAQELEQKLVGLLNEKYTKDAHVTVFIKEYQKVSVIGAVSKPGVYELVGPTTLLQVIAQAGGTTNQSTNELYIYRRGKDGSQTRIVIKLDDLMANGNQFLLQPQDVVTVPVDQTVSVYVYGEVRTPGAVPYLRSKKITLLQAVAQAGGTTEWAHKSRVTIKRKDKITGREVKIPVDLKKIIGNKMADIILEEGDVIIVP